MSIFDFLSGQFIDVIHWTDDTRDTMVWRFERHGHEIKYGAKLTVREGQAAVFVHEGQLREKLIKLSFWNLPLGLGFGNGKQDTSSVFLWLAQLVQKGGNK